MIEFQIASEQLAKAVKDAGDIIAKISLAKTDDHAIELAAEARGYVTALADQQLIEHSDWMEMQDKIKATYTDWADGLESDGYTDWQWAQLADMLESTDSTVTISGSVSSSGVIERTYF